MTSYPFIEQLFKNVLYKSKAIQGRFYICSKGGNEMNSDALGQVLSDALMNITSKKYPLVLMMPPKSQGQVIYGEVTWERYFINTFWLNSSYIDSDGQIASVNPNTLTSLHPVSFDWHDMKRAASNFIRVLDQLQRLQAGKNLLNYFRLSSDVKTFVPVSEVGQDRASGVSMGFLIEMPNDCELEDYNSDDISTITIPAADPHPEHQL